MTLALHRSNEFNRDFDLQYRWYLERAGETIAEGYLEAVLATLRLLATRPDLGRPRKFRHPTLRGIRFIPADFSIWSSLGLLPPNLRRAFCRTLDAWCARLATTVG
jgi:plasmid stabilization system protein ParE